MNQEHAHQKKGRGQGPDHKSDHNHGDHAHMVADFRRRFWVSLIFTIPILALSPMIQGFLGLREAITFKGDLYVLFGLSSVVFFYGGYPFLKEEPKNAKEVNKMKQLLLMVCIGLVILTGCKGKEEPVKSEEAVSVEEVKKEAKEAVETVTTFTQQQMDEYQKEIEARLKEYDKKLDELKARSEKMEKEAKAEVDQQMNELRKKRDAASKKLEELRSTSGKAWADLKAGLDAALEDMEKAYEQAFSRFK